MSFRSCLEKGLVPWNNLYPRAKNLNGKVYSSKQNAILKAHLFTNGWKTNVWATAKQAGGARPKGKGINLDLWQVEEEKPVLINGIRVKEPETFFNKGSYTLFNVEEELGLRARNLPIVTANKAGLAQLCLSYINDKQIEIQKGKNNVQMLGKIFYTDVFGLLRVIIETLADSSYAADIAECFILNSYGFKKEVDPDYYIKKYLESSEEQILSYVSKANRIQREVQRW